MYEAAERLGGIDIVFANAGVGDGAPLGSITEEHFQLLFDINVKGVVFTVQTLLPLIREHGSIILNSSVAADRGRPEPVCMRRRRPRSDHWPAPGPTS